MEVQCGCHKDCVMGKGTMVDENEPEEDGMSRRGNDFSLPVTIW